MPLAVATSWCSTRCSSSCARWARPRAAPFRPSKLSGLTASTDREVDSLGTGGEGSIGGVIREALGGGVSVCQWVCYRVVDSRVCVEHRFSAGSAVCPPMPMAAPTFSVRWDQLAGRYSTSPARCMHSKGR